MPDDSRSSGRPATAEELLEELLDYFGHSPTPHQYKAFHGLSRFLLTDKPMPAFVLNGAAGTGKTTMMRALVRLLERLETPYVLLAPTGRAAKVISRRAARTASTIHKYIYHTATDAHGAFKFRRRRNEDPKGTVYIVDEASMIGEGGDLGATSGSLLQDLMDYVFPPGLVNRLIFVGDRAQLPPIGSDFSPALSPQYLKEEFGLTAGAVEMTQVRRQALDSGILASATLVRAALSEGQTEAPPVFIAPDVVALEDANDLLERFTSLFDVTKPERAIVLTYSNLMASQVNKAIRARFFDEPEPLMENDLVVVVRNFYQAQTEALPFIANGDAGRVVRVLRRTEEESYGLKWCDAIVEFQGLDLEPVEVTAKVPLDLLEGKDPSLSYDITQKLYTQRRHDFLMEAAEEAERSGRKARRFEPKADPYLNALQLKHGYAITGHKAQGGQWEHVFVCFEPALSGRLRSEDYTSFLRWVYTAFTRASEKLYLFNAPFDWVDMPDVLPNMVLDDSAMETFE